MQFKAMFCNYVCCNKHFMQGQLSDSIAGGVIQAQGSARSLKHFYRQVLYKKWHSAPFGKLSNLLHWNTNKQTKNTSFAVISYLSLDLHVTVQTTLEMWNHVKCENLSPLSTVVLLQFHKGHLTVQFHKGQLTVYRIWIFEWNSRVAPYK